ncbi:hypothetical protein ABL78_0608 [Leptomonas seymouri]|uniref:Uncharacterized protein n=1 Tax=Leptomonas seymouri TaxID=5684 RepID=A0A0N0P8Q6_LEPSE|nr:hypothetical protein ABL78_0608 [Leptomonas seymouri]|eukprot:KPI90226.1 hypothetical protein ABL78_0608 [Leptomonas seymouri]
MSWHFCGIPYTQPNQWELQLPPLADDGRAGASNAEAVGALTLQLPSFDFYADFYNEHHTCCWPRTLFDTHVGEAAEAVERGCAEDKFGADATFSPAEGEGKAGEFEGSQQDSSRARRNIKADVYVKHLIQVAEQLFGAQQEKPPRAPYARRIVYHNAVPPVLRCSEDSDAFVYVLQGQFVLQHCCRRRCSAELLQERRDFGCDCTEQQCTHAQRMDALAGEVFPLFLIMVPSADCAGYVDSEAGSASKSNGWRAQPLVLALESVTPTDPAPTETKDHEKSNQGDEHRRGDPRWCATYSSFTWQCNLLGNQRMSSMVRTTAAVARVPRRRPRTRPAALFSLRREGKSPSDSVGLEQLNSQGGCRSSDGVAANLPPLSLAFDIYATVYTSKAAKQHVLSQMRASRIYVPHITRTIRFGFGGSTSADGEVVEMNDEKLALARSRRPKQLMRLLESSITLRSVLPDNKASAPAEVDVRDEEGGNHAGDLVHAPQECCCFPPRKTPCCVAQQEESQRTSAHPQQTCVVAEPCVRTSFLGTLSTVQPIARELCVLPRSTSLVSVLRKRTQSEPGRGGTHQQKREACVQRDCSGGWPLRVKIDVAADAERVVELSPLHTLQDLANALRDVSE